MVGSNDREEGTTQLIPELWIDSGIMTFLSPSLNDSDLKKKRWWILAPEAANHGDDDYSRVQFAAVQMKSRNLLSSLIYC